MHRTVVLALAGALALVARPLRAQFTTEGSPSDAAAYVAITSTPMGGLPAVITTRFAGTGRRGIGLRTQFGHIDEDGPLSRRIFGVGLDVPLGASTLGLTGGFVDFACDQDALSDAIGGFGVGIEVECAGGFMAGANWTAPLLTAPLGTAGNTAFMVGVDGAVGYGSGDLIKVRVSDEVFPGLPLSFALEARTLSVGLGFPLALVVKSPGITIVPHLTPRIGHGRMTLEFPLAGVVGEDEDTTDSGTRFVLGGGLQLLFVNSGLGLNLGLQKVFVDGANTVLGAGLSYSLR